MYNHLMRLRRSSLPLFIVLGAVLVACQSREVEKVLKVTDVKTGWYDVGIVNGENKIVPSVSFHLRNVSAESIENVQILTVFRRQNEAEAWGATPLMRGVGSDGLAAGATGRTLVARNTLGYTSIEPRAQMLKNKEFIDAKVDLFARHGSRTWMKIGEFPIERKLLTTE